MTRIGKRRLSYVRNTWKKLAVMDIKAISEEVHTVSGRAVLNPNCEFMIRLRASPHNGVELLHELLGYPGYRPEQSGLDALASSPDLFRGRALTEFQIFWINELVRHPFELIGRGLADLIKDRGDKFVPEIWPTIIDYFEANHKVPKSFFSEPKVLAMVPVDERLIARLTGLPCRGRPDLQGSIFSVKNGKPHVEHKIKAEIQRDRNLERNSESELSKTHRRRHGGTLEEVSGPSGGVPGQGG